MLTCCLPATLRLPPLARPCSLRTSYLPQDDPYVELKVHGLPCDTQSVRTEHANDTGRLVVDKTFELSVSFPEMAVLVLLLKDLNIPHTDVVLGQAALPLATLAPGEYKLQLAEPYVCWSTLGSHETCGSNSRWSGRVHQRLQQQR